MDLPAISQRDALNYLTAVKYTIGEENYNEFLDAVKQVDMTRVQQLLANEHHLIIGFNAFMANGMKIPVPDELPTQKPSRRDAVAFLDKLKERRPHQHGKILAVLGKYMQELIAVHHVYEKVKLLLHDEADSDLMEDFRLFLPREAFHPVENPVIIHNKKKNHHKKSITNSAASPSPPPPADNNVEKDEGSEVPITDRLRKRPRVEECTDDKVCRRPVELGEAIEFAYRLKMELPLQGQYRANCFNSVLDAMRQYRVNPSVEAVHQHLGMLLQHNHPQLLDQLERFLPASYRGARVNPSYRLILSGASDGGGRDASVVNKVCCSVRPKIVGGHAKERRPEDANEDKLYLLEMTMIKLPRAIGNLQELWDAQKKRGDDRKLLECIDSTSIMCIKWQMGEEKGAEYVKMKARHALPIIVPALKKQLKDAVNERAKMEQGSRRRHENGSKRRKS